MMLNAERKQLTEEAAERADIALQEGDALQDRVLVLYDAEIHESIAGIVAGRIKDKYYRPTILITGSEDGAKGSGRSIEGYHCRSGFIYALWRTCHGGRAFSACRKHPCSAQTAQ